MDNMPKSHVKNKPRRWSRDRRAVPENLCAPVYVPACVDVGYKIFK